MGKHLKGRAKGKFNGESRYKGDFTNQIKPMRSYHVIKVAELKVAYRGNTPSCDRCHSVPSHCPGGGIASKCRTNQGPLDHLYDHVKSLLNQLRHPPQVAASPTRQGHADTLVQAAANTQQAAQQLQTATTIVEQPAAAIIQHQAAEQDLVAVPAVNQPMIALDLIQVNSGSIQASQEGATEPEKDKAPLGEEDFYNHHHISPNNNDEISEEASDHDDVSNDISAENEDKDDSKSRDLPGLNFSAKQKKKHKQRLARARRKAEAEGSQQYTNF